MADQLDPTEGLPGSEVAPGDDEQLAVVEGGEAVADDTPTNPVEALASEMGWAPKDQFRGDPEDWKPADQFIRAGKDIQRNMSRELKELKSTVTNISRTSATLLEQQLAERDAYWRQQRQEAIDAGDHAAVDHADAQRQKIQQQAPVVQAPLDPAAESFTQKHAGWWEKDIEATKYAINRAQHYADQGLSSARQLAAVEQDMKGIFPDLFPAPPKPAPSVARPASRSAATTNRSKSLHDLPAEAQAVARDMVARGVIPNTEVYVANWFNQPERRA